MLPGLSPVRGKTILARFDGACMSSDGGLLALREVEQRFRIAPRLAACIDDPRAPHRVVHGLDEIIRTRMLTIAAGYEDGNMLRLRLIKLAVRIKVLKTQVRLHLPWATPDQAIFAWMLGRVPRLMI